MGDVGSLYWDACCFLSYINGIKDRIVVLEEILRRADDHDIVIVTSVISVVEVAFVLEEQTKRKLSKKAEQRIDRLLGNKRAVMLVELHERIAKDARSLMRTGLTHGLALKPMDAIHLATARSLSIVEVHSYDDRLCKQGAQLGMQVGPPNVDQGLLPLT
jgi:predicted nucleic acid-binding protein